MFPIIVDVQKVQIIVLGDGPATTRRVQALEEAGAEYEWVKSYSIPYRKGHTPLFIFAADFDEETSRTIYEEGKELGALVNVEDKIAYCDFHVPAMVRRGDLLVTVSTGGKSPRVARRARMMLEQLFPAQWAEWLQKIAAKRTEWKKEGLGIEEVAQRSDVFLDELGVFARECDCLRKARKI